MEQNLADPTVAQLGERFELRRCLGRGGFGVVYEAHDRERGMDVALKLLHRFEPTALYRFKREFRALTDIVHPNLCTLYELFSHGEQWYFTMELVRGVDLLSYVRRPGSTASPRPSFSEERNASLGTLPSTGEVVNPLGQTQPSLPRLGGDSSEALIPTVVDFSLALQAEPVAAETTVDYERLRQVLRQLAEGLCYLHDAGKLHRDLKPQNLLITPEGRVVILDFGLVRELIADGATLSNNAVAGTPAYMAPEQVRSEPPTPASDWYSVGTILYEALTGTLPFTGAWLDVLSRKLRQPPAPPSQHNPHIPRDLEELCLDLLRREAADRPSVRQILRRLALSETMRRRMLVDRPPPSGSQQGARTLLGRERHLRELFAAYRRVVLGQPVTVLLSGESGMGKSVLARQFLEQISHLREEGAVVLSGRCYQQESVPYKALDAVVDALSQHLKQLPQAEAQALLPRDIRFLARLFPVLLRVRAVQSAPRQDVESAEVAGAAELRRRAFESLRELLGRLSDRQPLCIFIDDLQWGDVDSGTLLLDLLGHRDTPVLLLLLSYRSEEEHNSPCLRALLPALRRRAKLGGVVRELSVAELHPEEARGLALTLLSGGEPPPPQSPAEAAEAHEVLLAQAESIARESGGRPFFIDELVRAVPAAGRGQDPGLGAVRGVRLEDVILRRVSALPEPARRLLEVAAVAAKPLSLQVALSAATAEGQSAPALGEQALLRSGRLIRLRESGDHAEIETYHNRIRETVVAHLDAAAARAYHQRLAEALQRSGEGDPETLAQHFEAAGEGRRAAQLAVQAAQKAEVALAFDRAARLYQLALHLSDTRESALRPVGAGPEELRLRLAHALRNAGRGQEAAQSYLQCATDAERRRDLVAALELRRQAAEQLLRSGVLREGLQVLRQVTDQVGVYFPRSPLSALLLLLVLRVLLRLRGLKPAGRRQSPEQRRRLDTCASATGLVISDTMRGAYFAMRELWLALQVGDPEQVLQALSFEVSLGAMSGGPRPTPREEQLQQQAKHLAEALGAEQKPQALGTLAFHQGIALVLRGGWEPGLLELRRAIGILRDQGVGFSWHLSSAYHFVLLCLGLLGRWREIRDQLPALLADARQRGDRFMETSILCRVGQIPHLMEDQPERGREEILSAVSAWNQDGGYYVQDYFSLISLSEVALYQGEGAGEEPTRLLQTHLPALRRSRLTSTQAARGDVLFARARAALALGAAVPSAQRARHITEAERIAAAMRRERITWIDAAAFAVQASVAAARGARGPALQALDQAIIAFGAASMPFYAAAARYRRGGIRGGDEGRVEQAEALRVFREQEVNNPTRLVAMLLPGLWSEL